MFGLRSMVQVGAMTLPAEVPAPSTLPGPSPPGLEEPEHPLAPLPVVRQINGYDTIRGAFFEVVCLMLSAPLSWCSQQQKEFCLAPIRDYSDHHRRP
jgi:hypothetical protein